MSSVRAASQPSAAAASSHHQFSNRPTTATSSASSSACNNQNYMIRKRSIRHHHKSKTGCLECRKAKIKCNERKPKCDNCVRRSDQCTYPVLAAQQNGASSSSSATHSRPLASSLFSSSSLSHYHQPTTSPTSVSASSEPQSQPSQQQQPFHRQQDPHLSVLPNGMYTQDLSRLRSINEVTLSPHPAISTLNIMHMELLHHWHTNTSSTVTRDKSMHRIWREYAPQIGLEHDYVFQAFLAVSARHLGHLKPAKKALYESAATALHAAALKSAAEVLPNFTEQNGHAIFLFSCITWIFTVATPDRPEELPPFAHTDTIADWLILLRGVVSVSSTAWPCLLRSDLSVIISTALAPSPTGTIPPAEEHLLYLKSLIAASLDVPPQDKLVYISLIDSLRTGFFTLNNVPLTSCCLAPIWAWGALVPESYVLLLGKREPEALVLFAYFAVLIAEVDHLWWLKGFARHVLVKIEDGLEGAGRCQGWIDWPREKIRRLG
ncbi:hypothetical protein K402DRAFT_396941 [Aulographum hederae CBS 113979]|uniref:Zn(2)-C6 fungal-type domain-containing protein n=1 Tax=Aulographum hederae CBS 113979 TaxID=1176131 RepID=A0A6G1GR58_9PEZI|nr:hypothetical protein K402DRAFT_396941 [Aulographum hederae CBS 113979]